MKISSEALAQARQAAARGHLPTFIPLLAAANPADFALSYRSLRGEEYVAGEPSLRFPLMSVVKPFLLLYLLCHRGQDSVFRHLGREPSLHPFNSLLQLQEDRGRPRNPMLNSGAIYLASLLEDTDDLARWLNALAGTRLELDTAMLESVRSLPNRYNHDLARLMADSGHLVDPARALAVYNHVCCLAATVADLSRLGLLLLQPPPGVEPAHCQTTQDLMSNCGLYEASADFAARVGFPSKSGVSGAILALVPADGAIACYSPPLDAAGNSVAGMLLLHRLAAAPLSPRFLEAKPGGA